ncbi:MAG TPA: DUF5668 domain-containing protein [Thermoanaerobaculia bacterium]
MEQQLTRPAPVATAGVKLVIGIFFTALGLLMALDNLQLFDAWLLLRYWPVVLVVIGILKFNDETSRDLAIVAIVLGVLILAVNTRWVRVSIFDLWPLLLIGAGVFIVAQAFGFKQAAGWTAIFSQRKVTIDSRNFTGGRIVAFMGGCEMDLTDADIEQGPAIIELFVLMGGIEIRVPDGWEVVGNVVPFMGGVDIKTKSKRTGRQLIVRGFVMMGGVEIKDLSARIK